VTVYPVSAWRELREQGLSYRAIARQYGVSQDTVLRWLAGHVKSPHARQRAQARAERHFADVRASKHLARCQRCGIILERSGCIGHDNDRPDAVYCWTCREELGT